MAEELVLLSKLKYENILKELENKTSTHRQTSSEKHYQVGGQSKDDSKLRSENISQDKPPELFIKKPLTKIDSLMNAKKQSNKSLRWIDYQI